MSEQPADRNADLDVDHITLIERRWQEFATLIPEAEWGDLHAGVDGVHRNDDCAVLGLDHYLHLAEAPYDIQQLLHEVRRLQSIVRAHGVDPTPLTPREQLCTEHWWEHDPVTGRMVEHVPHEWLTPYRGTPESTDGPG